MTSVSKLLTGSVGSGTKLAVVDGKPVISYMDFTNNDLKYARASLGSVLWTAVDP